MKSKKGAFANSATGYGKRHNHNCNKSANKSTKATESSSPEAASNNNRKGGKHVGLEAEKPKPEDDNDLNSGFGTYLRSDEGVEMMKIFVFANTVMMIVTIAWPHVKEQYIWLMEGLDSFQQY